MTTTSTIGSRTSTNPAADRPPDSPRRAPNGPNWLAMLFGGIALLASGALGMKLLDDRDRRADALGASTGSATSTTSGTPVGTAGGSTNQGTTSDGSTTTSGTGTSTGSGRTSPTSTTTNSGSPSGTGGNSAGQDTGTSGDGRPNIPPPDAGADGRDARSSGKSGSRSGGGSSGSGSSPGGAGSSVGKGDTTSKPLPDAGASPGSGRIMVRTEEESSPQESTDGGF